MDESRALELAKQGFSASTSYMESNLLDVWEENERLFQSRHPKGSKYESSDYRLRSKLFKPKTRSTMQINEADCAFAFFGNDRLLQITPQNSADPVQRASASITQELIQYRLEQSIPWYHVVVGAFQDASKNDICAAYTYWDYQEIDGEVYCDKPVIELLPVENLRFDPAADWANAVNDSPYLIHILPMTVDDVMTRMAEPDQKTGEPKWRKLKEEDIRAAHDSTHNRMREERDYPRENPLERERWKTYDIVYVHRNFFREKGRDYVYYTLGTRELLSKPVPAREVYNHLRIGERPYVIGHVALEAHRPYPDSGSCGLMRNLQREVNDLANLRMDTVKMAVMGRHLVKRQATIDYDTLRKSIPGSGILVDNPDTDICRCRTPQAGVITSSNFLTRILPTSPVHLAHQISHWVAKIRQRVGHRWCRRVPPRLVTTAYLPSPRHS